MSSVNGTLRCSAAPCNGSFNSLLSKRNVPFKSTALQIKFMPLKSIRYNLAREL